MQREMERKIKDCPTMKRMHNQNWQIGSFKAMPTLDTGLSVVKPQGDLSWWDLFLTTEGEVAFPVHACHCLNPAHYFHILACQHQDPSLFITISLGYLLSSVCGRLMVFSVLWPPGWHSFKQQVLFSRVGVGGGHPATPLSVLQGDKWNYFPLLMMCSAEQLLSHQNFQANLWFGRMWAGS